jgi:hypothetical protein
MSRCRQPGTKVPAPPRETDHLAAQIRLGDVHRHERPLQQQLALGRLTSDGYADPLGGRSPKSTERAPLPTCRSPAAHSLTHRSASAASPSARRPSASEVRRVPCSQEPRPRSSCSPSTVNRSRPDRAWTTAVRAAACSVSCSSVSTANTVTFNPPPRFTTLETTAQAWMVTSPAGSEISVWATSRSCFRTCPRRISGVTRVIASRGLGVIQPCLGVGCRCRRGGW